MIGRFPALVRCDRDHCETLVEPDVGRCFNCRTVHGHSPNAIGARGHALPNPKPGRKRKPWNMPAGVPLHIWQQQVRRERERGKAKVRR